MSVPGTYSVKLTKEMWFHRSANQSDRELCWDIQNILSRNKIKKAANFQITKEIQYLLFLLNQKSMHLVRYLYSREDLAEKTESYLQNEKPDARGFYLLKKASYTEERILPCGLGILSEHRKKNWMDKELDKIDPSELVADPYQLKAFIADKKTGP
jgi:hypothetical protein